MAETPDNRPFLDSEHGPIHSFKDRRINLPEAFDDEYFRHIQWAHFASGGAGGGMRWPNRHPHSLTSGMRAHQLALSRFLPLIDWTRFRRRNLNHELAGAHPALATFGCGDEDQAILWLLRREPLARDGRLRRDTPPLRLEIAVPDLQAGRYRITAWDTVAGAPVHVSEVKHAQSGPLQIDVSPFPADLALAIRRTS